MKTNLKRFKGKTVRMKVRDATKNGKSIYKNIKGCEDKINEILIDLPSKKSGLKKLMITMNIIPAGKVNKQFKMTRGHKHKTDEVYIFLKGSGDILVGKKKFKVKKGDLVTVPANSWHRVVNKGRNDFVFLSIFGKHGKSHLKKY